MTYYLVQFEYRVNLQHGNAGTIRTQAVEADTPHEAREWIEHFQDPYYGTRLYRVLRVDRLERAAIGG